MALCVDLTFSNKFLNILIIHASPYTRPASAVPLSREITLPRTLQWRWHLSQPTLLGVDSHPRLPWRDIIPSPGHIIPSPIPMELALFLAPYLGKQPHPPLLSTPSRAISKWDNTLQHPLLLLLTPEEIHTSINPPICQEGFLHGRGHDK